ncbi:MAG: PIN domain-containing protein [Pirellulales bacterium]|nr:PIN domain-containing protein [Pirellulales bacterium]
MKKIFLLDVNVWVALVFDHHDHHAPALSWVQTVGDETLAFCRMTQQGLLRLATNERVLREHAVTLKEAWALYDRIAADFRVSLAPEPTGLEREWRRLTQTNRPSTHLWNDAYLAAFATCAGLEIVTFDRGFEQFTLQRCTILARADVK